LLVKSTLNQPSFGGGSFVHSCPSPHSTNIWDTLLENSIPTSFFWTDLIATFLHVYYFWG
jgi:hypothetical protein